MVVDPVDIYQRLSVTRGEERLQGERVQKEREMPTRVALFVAVVVWVACVSLGCHGGWEDMADGSTRSQALSEGAVRGASSTIYLSTKGSHILGHNLLSSTDGDVVSYETAMDTSLSFFEENLFRRVDGSRGAQEEVDAFHVLESGQIVLSTRTAARLGDPMISVHKGDLVLYDPIADRARILLDHSVFLNANGGPARAVDIDGVTAFRDGRIALSTKSDARLPSVNGVLSFRDGDIVLYDPASNAAEVLLEEDVFRRANGDRGAPADIDALHVFDDGTILLSTFATERLGQGLLTVRSGDLVRYDPGTDMAWIELEQDVFRKRNGDLGGREDVDAVSVSEGGRYETVISVKSGARLGSNLLPLADGDAVSYDGAVDVATPVFSEGLFRNAAGDLGANEEVDAFHYHESTGGFVLSTRTNAWIGDPQISVRPGDLVHYDPRTDTAHVFFSQDNFRKADGTRGAQANIDAVFVDAAGRIYLSTKSVERLGAAPATLEFKKGDLILYDPGKDTASLILTDEIYRRRNGEAGAVADIDAIHVLGPGQYILSTFAAERIGANVLPVKDGDLIFYDSRLDLARVDFSEANFRKRSGDLGASADIDAVSLMVSYSPPQTL
jgi:uncharacterized protein YuzE